MYSLQRMRFNRKYIEFLHARKHRRHCDLRVSRWNFRERTELHSLQNVCGPECSIDHTMCRWSSDRHNERLRMQRGVLRQRQCLFPDVLSMPRVRRLRTNSEPVCGRQRARYCLVHLQRRILWRWDHMHAVQAVLGKRRGNSLMRGGIDRRLRRMRLQRRLLRQRDPLHPVQAVCFQRQRYSAVRRGIVVGHRRLLL